MTVSTLKSLRNDANFDLFWQKITASAEDLDADKPTLLRPRKAPWHLDGGSASTFHMTVEDHYRAVYFEVPDLITSCIEDHFNQRGYRISPGTPPQGCNFKAT